MTLCKYSNFFLHQHHISGVSHVIMKHINTCPACYFLSIFKTEAKNHLCVSEWHIQLPAFFFNTTLYKWPNHFVRTFMLINFYVTQFLLLQVTTILTISIFCLPARKERLEYMKTPRSSMGRRVVLNRYTMLHFCWTFFILKTFWVHWLFGCPTG